MQLSPITSYYIRKLLLQNIQNLKWIVLPGAAIQADPLGDLDAVLGSLYLEEAEIKAVIRSLEKLTTYHQALTSQGSQYGEEVFQAERTIFWLLGFKWEPGLGKWSDLMSSRRC